MATAATAAMATSKSFFASSVEMIWPTNAGLTASLARDAASLSPLVFCIAVPFRSERHSCRCGAASDNEWLAFTGRPKKHW